MLKTPQQSNSRLGRSPLKQNSRSNSNLSAQVKIYNRHFYLRQAEHDYVQDQYKKQLKKLANTPKITPSSYILLSQKVEQNISQAIKRQVGEHTQEVLMSFGQVQGIIKQFLDFGQKYETQEETLHCQLWVLACGYNIQRVISTKVIISLFRILLDPYNLSVSEMRTLIEEIPSLQNLDQKRQLFIKQHQDVQDQTLTINKTLSLWNQSRKYYSVTKGFRKSTTNPVFQQRKHFTYKPTINQKSQKLAEKDLCKYLYNNKARLNIGPHLQQDNGKHEKRSPDQLSRYLHSTEHNTHLDTTQQNSKRTLSYHEILYKRPLQKDTMIKTPQSYNSNKDFNPQTSRIGKPEDINAIVNNLYFIKQRREDLDYSSIREEQDLKRCSFQPKINRSSSARSVSPGVNGFNSTIQRLNKGRQEELRKKQAYQNLGRVKKPLDLIKKQPPSFIERDAPKLILQVKIDHDRIQNIKLKGDEDPHIVAKKFVLKHSLSQSMQSVLEELVEEQLSCL